MRYTMIISILLHCCLALKTNATIPRRYDSIFNFGDSLSDTGNFLHTEAVAFPAVAKLPYGKTFFGHPTSCFSDGRLRRKYSGSAKSWHGGTLKCQNLQMKKRGGGVIGEGCAALTATTVAAPPSPGRASDGGRGLAGDVGPRPVAGDTGPSRRRWGGDGGGGEDCDTYFKKSLFLVGEIGGNDYNFLFTVGASFEQLRSMVPLVVGAISSATSALIEEGAVELVVPGNFPIGCWTVYLALFQSSNESDYNPRTGCLKAYNEFSEYHNSYLERELQILRQKYHHARIMYADYYEAAIRLFRAPNHYGFNEGTQAACCGGGGPYNFDFSAMCGSNGSTLCTDPSALVNWDGIHLTEAAYRHIAEGLLHGPFTSPCLIASKSQRDNALASILLPKTNLCPWS
ncbi:hypothetical protein BT93_D0283 [Corymbia citriodora subsp. variegata]|nr:hypothetical protein BT93_D0283 [Corymbia citriodora subsp. variegata]